MDQDTFIDLDTFIYTFIDQNTFIDLDTLMNQ